MTNRTQSLRYAGSAIAAALAIASTSSLAQDASAQFPAAPPSAPAPVVVVPDIPASTIPEPTTQSTVVVPTNEPATVQPIPTTTVETPEPEAAPAPAATTTRTRAAEPAVRAAPEPLTPVAAPEPTAIEETTVLPPLTTAQPVEPVTPVTTTEEQRTANDDTGILALVLGGLAFLALAIWGFVTIGRRRPVRRYAAETPAKPVTTVAAYPVVAEPAPVVTREPIAITPRAETRLSGPSFTARQAQTTGALPHAGASIALPARMPEDYAERDALMKRMIAAKPDRANPFTDRGARTKRARLILQSLGRDFSNSEPWIDLSQYPNNWPELANKRSAAA